MRLSRTWSTTSGGTDDTFAALGTIGRERVGELSEGGSPRSPVRVNRPVVEDDVAIIVGPVLPHEVIGFSGGNKYLFPGLSGQELIDVPLARRPDHQREIIGTPGHHAGPGAGPRGRRRFPAERLALCVVVASGTGGLHAPAFGDPVVWAAARRRRRRDPRRVPRRPGPAGASRSAPRYADLWTGAKGFYKVEPIVADGGEVILYAPHITQIAATHPGIDDIGYHCRDYFLAHWDRFRDLPGASSPTRPTSSAPAPTTP